MIVLQFSSHCICLTGFCFVLFFASRARALGWSVVNPQWTESLEMTERKGKMITKFRSVHQICVRNIVRKLHFHSFERLWTVFCTNDNNHSHLTFVSWMFDPTLDLRDFIPKLVWTNCLFLQKNIFVFRQCLTSKAMCSFLLYLSPLICSKGLTGLLN